MKPKRSRNDWDGPLPWHEPLPKKKTLAPVRRWSPIHLIPIALLSAIAGTFIVHSCNEDDESEASASGGTGSGGHGFFHSYGGGGGSSQTAHSTDRGGFGSRGRSFFS